MAQSNRSEHSSLVYPISIFMAQGSQAWALLFPQLCLGPQWLDMPSPRAGVQKEKREIGTPQCNFREDNPHFHVLLRRLLSSQVTRFCIAALEG